MNDNAFEEIVDAETDSGYRAHLDRTLERNSVNAAWVQKIIADTLLPFLWKTGDPDAAI